MPRPFATEHPPGGHAGASRRLGLALALLAATAAAAHGGHGDRLFARLGSAEGLSQLTVRALAQDRQGFVWIGTQEGLHRFDGMAMRVFRHRPGDPTSLGASRVSALLLDSRGVLWVGTRGGGLARYDADRERFTVFRHDPASADSLGGDDVAALAEDRRGRLWVATTRNGLDRLQPDGRSGWRFVHHRASPGDPTSLPDDRLRSLLVDRQGTLWVGGMGGLSRLVGEQPARFASYRHDEDDPYSLADDEVYALHQDRRGVLWIGSWGGGLDRLDPGDRTAGRFRHHRHDPGDPFSLPDDEVMLILEDRRGTFWIGTLGGGLAELPASERDAPRPRFLRHPPDPGWSRAIADAEVHTALEDRDGDLWFGTSNGVSRLDRLQERLTYYRQVPGQPDSLRDPDVTDVAESQDGVLWVGSNRGLHRIVAGPDRFTPATVDWLAATPGAAGEPVPGIVSALLAARDGTLWIATENDGLYALPAGSSRAARPRFRHYPPAPDDPRGLATNAILSLHEDSTGTLWVGTYRGLYRALPGAGGLAAGFAAYRHDRADPRTLSSDRVDAIAEGPPGTLWLGTYYGLNRLRVADGQITRFLPDSRRPRSLSYEHVQAVHVDARGTLWAGTWGGGLNRLDGDGAFTTFGVGHGLPSDTIHAITSAANGSLWLATPQGLVPFDPRSGGVERWTARDGLLDDEVRGLRPRRDGGLFLASAHGLTLFAPGRAAAGPPPPVVLTALRLRNEPVPIDGEVLRRAIGRTPELALRHSQYPVAFEFAALAYRRPEMSRYAYRLDGVDRGWITTDASDRRAVYSSLPPGDHVFRVRAADAAGGWSGPGTTLRVRALPPWWRTWWARGCGLLAVVATALAWHRSRTARLRQLATLLEHKVDERTAELAEANRRLAEAARTDALTGLPNRRAFLERAELEAAAQRRSGWPCCLALGDVDRFKSINDSWGHDCGDYVLREVAAVLRRSVREHDAVARWGGEEFILLLPGTDATGGLVLADKVRQAIAAHHFEYQGRQIPVTLTLGIAELTVEGSLAASTARADGALYQGKREGRNRVVVAPLEGAAAPLLG